MRSGKISTRFPEHAARQARGSAEQHDDLKPHFRASIQARRSAPLLLVMALLLACGPASAQRNMNPETYYRAPSSMHGKTVVLPAGTTFEGRMDSSVGSRISHQGERFTITLSTPVLSNGTDVIIPAGAQVVGEVVEAIPSSKLPYNKKTQPKPNGKLRVQLSSLQTPDGMTYPLVASMTGETIKMGRRSMNNPSLGGGVGYMGSSTSFEAVAPGMSDRSRGRGGRGPQVVTKQQMMRDAIYGMGNTNNAMDRMASPTIRSLQKREHELCIDSGSPITIRLDAPFKIGISNVSPGEVTGGIDTAPAAPFPGDGGSDGGRRFSRTNAPAQGPAPSAFPGDTASGGGPPPTGAPAQGGPGPAQAQEPQAQPPQAQAPQAQAPQPASTQQPPGQDSF